MRKVIMFLLSPIAVLVRMRGPLAREKDRLEGWETAWPRPDDGDAGIMDFLAGVLKRWFRGWVAVFGLQAANALMTGIVTLVLSRLAQPLEKGEFSVALRFLWLFLFLRLLQLLAELGMNFLRVSIRTEMGCVMRQDILRRVLRLPIGFYHRIEHGAVIQHLNQDVAATIDLATGFWLAIFESVLTVVFVGAAALWLDWRISLWVVAMTFCTIPVVRLARREVARISKRLFSVNGRILSLVQECLFAIKYVKAMGIEEQEGNRLGGFLRENRAYEVRAATLYQSVGPVLEFVYLVLVCIVLWGALTLFPGSLRVGIIVPLSYGLLRVFAPIRKTIGLFVGFDQAWQSAQRVYWTHSYDPDRHLPRVARKKPELPVTQIQFQDVTFGFTKDTPCLRNISFHLARGQLVALVGESGAGKTTICDLIMGLHDEYSGSIRIGNVLLSEIDGPSYRSLLAYVPQEPLLIHDTIRNNLIYGIDGKVSDDQVVEALSRAGALGFVRQLHDGLDTPLSEHGGNLAGGERQRLCLARALLRSPQLLVLDEATSMLDHENEKILLQALSRLKQDMIVLFVSHRMQVVEYADRILMVEDGVLREVLVRQPS